MSFNHFSRYQSSKVTLSCSFWYSALSTGIRLLLLWQFYTSWRTVGANTRSGVECSFGAPKVHLLPAQSDISHNTPSICKSQDFLKERSGQEDDNQTKPQKTALSVKHASLQENRSNQQHKRVCPRIKFLSTRRCFTH